MFPTFIITLIFISKLTVAALQPIGRIQTLGAGTFSLSNRYTVASVSDVFAKNILLTLFYMRGAKPTINPDWTAVQKPFSYGFILQPGQVFAFHQDILPQFEGKVVKTTNSQFSSDEGFVSDGYLVADGVCHLASLINEAATRAGLDVLAPTNHNFAIIPGVNRRYGTAIYFMPGEKNTNAMQNLYVKNNKDKPVIVNFIYKDNDLTISFTEIVPSFESI